jgi:hypothetical protein
MDAAMASVQPEDRAFGKMQAPWGQISKLAEAVVDGRIRLAQKDLAGAILRFQDAVRIQDKLPFDDIPNWYYPVRESLGAALLRNGQSREAEEVFRDDILGTPRNPRSLFGLYKALDRQHKSVEASEVYREFKAGWRGALEPRLEDM